MALLLMPMGAAAQAVGILTGTVQSADSTPVAFAQISVIGERETGLTNLAGVFRMSLPTGSQVVHIRAVGYEVAFIGVEIAAGAPATIHVSLVAAAIVLPSVEILGARQPRPGLEGYELRRARHEGHFLDSVEIARMQSRQFTDVLRRIPGVQVTSVRSVFGSGEAVRMTRMSGTSGTRPCPVLYYMNGHLMPVTGDVSIDEYVRVDEIVAVEVYTGVSQIPSEFNATQHNARCGVIVIWTSTGGSTDSP